MVGPDKQEALQSKKTGLSTFGGVFTPSILTILGVIMYLRFGWVVGNVGLIGSLLIVTLSTVITFLTALSIAAIATDQRVRIGGAYYMISRSLGIESGGAIGIPLYFAQALSVALYTVGFAESVVGAFPGADMQIVGIITTVGVAALALISANVAIKAQYFIMFGIALSLLSLLFGSPLENSQIEMWGAASENSEPFWVVFAVFFPAVTGIMAGVNMSGDLKDPGKSLPRGTFAAIGVGYVIYMLLPILLASRVDAITLVEDPLIMRKISYWGDAILIGVWGATLSSAVGSILGAPRVLQALARDGVLPRSMRWMGKGSGQDDTPRLGTLFTLGIALIAVWFGNLNIIAPILTMFFLTTYGVLNLAAAVERFLGSPSFRPKFKVHWIFSLLGAIGCIAVMILINALAVAVAAVFVLAIYIWLRRREMESTWGDVWRGIWMALTREGLMRLGAQPEPKNWRPNPLVLSGAPTKRWHLVQLADNMTHNRGLMTVSTVLVDEDARPERVHRLEANIREYVAKRGIQTLVRVTAHADPFEGSKHLVDNYGLGTLVPNTILLGDSESPEARNKFCEMIRHFYSIRRNVLIYKRQGSFQEVQERRNPDKTRYIDVWWGGLKGNGGLMIILAYLLQKSIAWRGSEVRVKMIVKDPDGVENAQMNLERILDDIRISADPIVMSFEDRKLGEIIRKSSSDADLVLLGMAEPKKQDFLEYYENMQELARDLPDTLFVLAAQELSFEEVLL